MSPAEELPGIYLAILKRVAELEVGGERHEAALIRSAATRAYSRAWDEKARHELLGLLRRATAPTTAERMIGRGRAADRRRRAHPGVRPQAAATPDH
jgi:hypothetical protein